MLPPLQPGQQDLRDAAWLNSANLALWRRFMWLTLTTTAPTKAQPRRGAARRGALRAASLGARKPGFEFRDKDAHAHAPHGPAGPL